MIIHPSRPDLGSLGDPVTDPNCAPEFAPLVALFRVNEYLDNLFGVDWCGLLVSLYALHKEETPAPRGI